MPVNRLACGTDLAPAHLQLMRAGVAVARMRCQLRCRFQAAVLVLCRMRVQKLLLLLLLRCFWCCRRLERGQGTLQAPAGRQGGEPLQALVRR